jgi:hypothetical protein
LDKFELYMKKNWPKIRKGKWDGSK